MGSFDDDVPPGETFPMSGAWAGMVASAGVGVCSALGGRSADCWRLRCIGGMALFQVGRFRPNFLCYTGAWQRATMSETRKLAAILAADLFGYSRLMGLTRPRRCAI